MINVHNATIRVADLLDSSGRFNMNLYQTTYTGVQDYHSQLRQLDYATAGHTGFASTAITDALDTKIDTTSGTLQQAIDDITIGAVSHNNTTGKQGGTASEYYHLTSAEYTELQAGYLLSSDFTIYSGTLQSQITTNTTNISSNDVDISNLQTDLATVSGVIVDQIITTHSGLSGLDADDHTQYVLADGSRDITGQQTIYGDADGDFLGAEDLIVGNTDYGVMRIGDLQIGTSSNTVSNLNLDGTCIIRLVDGPTIGPIEYAIIESSNAVRFAIPESGAGKGTYNSRSMIIAGPAVYEDAIVSGTYWGFDKLEMDTSSGGADLGVQNDVQILNDLFVDNVAESTTGSGVIVDSVNVGDFKTSYDSHAANTDAHHNQTHDNTDHSDTYIEATDVTYENLDANGDVGTGANTVASGNHAHSYLADIIEDTTPQLGANLDVNGNSIVSVSDGDVAVTPNGTGDVILDGLKWPQADGSSNQYLITNGSAQLSWATVSSGISNHGVVPTTSGSYSGRTFTITCDDTAIVGSPLYIKSTGNLGLADATISGTMPVAFISVTDGTGSIACVNDGYICNTDWNWTPGKYTYVTTSSDLSHDNPTASGNWIQPVGRAMSADTIVVDIQVELLI